jgi:hypothetical protein
MSCRDGSCEYGSRLSRNVKATLEQQINADLWLKEYVTRLRKERPELLERVLREEKANGRQNAT